jgi:hypothetical protein
LHDELFALLDPGQDAEQLPQDHFECVWPERPVPGRQLQPSGGSYWLTWAGWLCDLDARNRRHQAVVGSSSGLRRTAQ